MTTSLYSLIINTLFPKKCFVCKKEGESFCEECLQACKEPLDTPFLFITSAFSFKNQHIKKAVHAIKYFHRRDLVEPLTKRLAQTIKNDVSPQKFILVPIPMPKLRKLTRGYNQAELIANNLSQKCSLPTRKDILIRTRSPIRQVMNSTRSARLKNQHNSFKVITDIRGLNILLVDDVTTTGATLLEARTVLLKSGASSVRAITIAH